MIDHYSVLGVHRNASHAEIRSAYIALVKVLHPDCRGPSSEGEPSLADLNLAYWTLRDIQRRAAFDRMIGSLVPPRRSGRPSMSPRGPWTSRPRRRRGSTYASKTMRRCGALLLIFAAAGGMMGTMAPQSVDWELVTWVPASGRPAPIDSGHSLGSDPVEDAATADLEAILSEAGVAGAAHYGRECFAELLRQPDPTLAEYCLAFERRSVERERTMVKRRADRRLVDERARSDSHEVVPGTLPDGPIRETIAAEVDR